MSLYSEYLLERTSIQIIETPQGFITFKFNSDNSCYIEDLYVKPEFRRSHVASELADQVCVIARSKGCTKLLGSVVPSAKNSTASMLILAAYGMKLSRSMNDFIVFEMEL